MFGRSFWCFSFGLSKHLGHSGSPFSRALAITSATLLICTSAGLGAYYAGSLGSEHSLLLVGLGISMALGLELAKPFSIAAAFDALRSSHFGQGLAVALLGLVAVGYSLSAELSLMANMRSDRVAERAAAQPFFWPRDRWIEVPPSWSPNIVTGKGFDTDTSDGNHLWQAVSERLVLLDTVLADGSGYDRYGKPVLIVPRLGQGAFRLCVTDSYERRCAITGEKTLPILDAAHIKSFSAGGEHTLSNGILMRTDIHRLFDLGYVTISPDGYFEVSQRLKADFDNGRHYYDLSGSPVRSPRNPEASPSSTALQWHRESCYLG